MRNIEKFRFFCHKIIPLVYDDSLSYYEFLCKVMQKLNECVDANGQQNEVIEEIEEKIEFEQSTGNRTDRTMSQKAITDALEEAAITPVQSTGQSTTAVMSQKGVTDAIDGVTITPVQSTGQSTTAVMSQKAVTDAIDAVEITPVQSTGQSTTDVMSQKAVTDAIDAAEITPVQSTGQSTTDVMSQKAVTDAIEDLEGGKQDKIDATHKLSADNVDDSTTTNKFVTSVEKTTWNGKQDALTAGDGISISGSSVISATGVITVETWNTFTKTLALSDANKLFKCSYPTNQTLTIPTNATVSFPIGTMITFILTSTYKVIFSGADGVTLTSTDDLVELKTQYAMASLIKIDTNTWQLVGALE